MDSIRPMSPVATQDFIWVAEYADGSYFTEFDMETKQENSFYSIEKDSLVRFGLVGHGVRCYHEVFGGSFKIEGRHIDLSLEAGGKEYPLTGLPEMYSDVITYKDAEATFSPDGGTAGSILQYNCGYKHQLKFPDLEISLRALCHIPKGQPMYLNFRLVANKKLDAVLKVRRNGQIVAEIPAKMKKDVGGEINWVVS